MMKGVQMDHIFTYSKSNPIPDEKFERVFSILESSFPKSERGNAELHRREHSRDNFRCMCCEPEGVPAAFINYYELPEQEFIFVEHFAVSEELRGKGVGSAMMRELIAGYSPLNIVLEVESPVDDITRRRVAFYQRLGFSLNSGAYFQPPFYGNPQPLPLKLMSTIPLSAASFESTALSIHHNIYCWQTNGMYH